MKKREDIRDEEVFRLYFEEGWWVARIARHLGVPWQTVQNRLARSGRALRPRGGVRRRRLVTPDPLRSDEPLRRLYLEENRPVCEIAEALGVPIGAVYKAMKRFGIERRRRVTSDLFDPRFDTVRPDGSFEIVVQAEEGVARASIYQFARRRGYRVSIQKTADQTYRVTRLT